MENVELFQMFYEEVCNTSQQMFGGIASSDAVVAIGVNVHVELFVSLYQCFAVFGCVA